MKISEFVNTYIEVRPAWLVLEDDQVTRNCFKAIRFYCGYANLSNVDLEDDEIHSAIGSGVEIDSENDFDITLSEWAIIRPLFDLYCEHENAAILEQTRGQGLDVFGRQVSEIQMDIREYEQNMHYQAFSEPFFTV